MGGAVFRPISTLSLRQRKKISAFVFGSKFHSTMYPQRYARSEDFLRANAFVFHERMEYSIRLFINFI